jgi:hypothetical protein
MKLKSVKQIMRSKGYDPSSKESVKRMIEKMAKNYRGRKT